MIWFPKFKMKAMTKSKNSKMWKISVKKCCWIILPEISFLPTGFSGISPKVWRTAIGLLTNLTTSTYQKSSEKTTVIEKYGHGRKSWKFFLSRVDFTSNCQYSEKSKFTDPWNRLRWNT